MQSRLLKTQLRTNGFLKDCVAVHQLVEVSFKDAEAASSKPTESLLESYDGHCISNTERSKNVFWYERAFSIYITEAQILFILNKFLTCSATDSSVGFLTSDLG